MYVKYIFFYDWQIEKQRRDIGIYVWKIGIFENKQIIKIDKFV